MFLALNTLSRLKGIETQDRITFPIKRKSLNTLSRLKGIETVQGGLDLLLLYDTLNTLSRLKGIETFCLIRCHIIGKL